MLKLPTLFEYKDIAVYRLPNKEYLLWNGQDYDTCMSFETVLIFIQNELDGTAEDLPF